MQRFRPHRRVATRADERRAGDDVPQPIGSELCGRDSAAASDAAAPEAQKTQKELKE